MDDQTKNKSLTLVFLEQIRDQANQKRIEIYKKCGWREPELLSAGDIRAVLDSYIELKDQEPEGKA